MIKETYERLSMDVTQFDAEDIITTSGETPDPITQNDMETGRFEYGLGLPVNT
jgi:hypothetical protein